MAARRPKQLAFTYRTHGGARRGAGRRPKGPRAGTPHRARPAHRREHPVHVTLRSRVRGLRTQRVFAAIREALVRVHHRDRTWGAFGVVDLSVQADHVHMLVEASDTAALRRGMRGLVIRLARAINKVLARKGPVWGDRWHGVALTSPRQVKRALAYVLMNHAKHAPASGHLTATPWIDPCSSALWFDGWRPGAALSGPAPPPPVPSPPTPSSSERRPTAAPSTWLRRLGWRRHGLLSPRDAPRAEAAVLRTSLSTTLSALSATAATRAVSVASSSQGGRRRRHRQSSSMRRTTRPNTNTSGDEKLQSPSRRSAPVASNVSPSKPG